MSKSDYLEDVVLNLVLRNTGYTPVGTVYLGLYTSATTDAGGGTEVSGGGYVRVAVTFGAPSPSGTTANSVAVSFPKATASWGTLTHGAIRDAATGGNLLYHGALTATKTVELDDTLSFPIGNIVVTED